MAIRFPGQPSLAGCQFSVAVWQQGQKSQVVKMVSKIRKKGKKSRRILFLLNTLSACPVDAQRWRLAQTAGATDALPCSAPRIWSTSRTRSRRSPRCTSTVGSRVGEPLHVLPPLGLHAIIGLPELAPFVSHRSAPLHNVLRDETPEQRQ